MASKLRWQVIPVIVVILLAAGGGLYFGAHGETIWVGVFAGLTILFVGLLFTLVFGSFFFSQRGSSVLMDMLLDTLIAYVRKHREIGLWFVGLVSLLFLILGVIWVVVVYQAPSEIAVGFIRATMWLEVVLLVVMFLGLLILFLARITAESRLSSLLADQITPELIAEKPQAAVEHAFTVFEDHLRKRIGASPQVYGKNLINEAFGQHGCLTYGETESERLGLRNLIAGVYGTFRNPRKHRVIADDEQTVKTLLALVDLLVQLVDECEGRNSSI